MRGEELLGQAERVVQQAIGRGADEAECYWEAGAGVGVDVHGGRIASADRSQASGAAVRLVRDGRLGFAYFTEPKDAASAVERALDNLRLAPRKGFSLPFPGRAAPLKGRWDPRLAGLDVELAVRLVHDLLQGAREAAPEAVVAGGGASLAADVVAVASSHGVAAWDRSTSVAASASLVLEEDGGAVTTDESDAAQALPFDAAAVGLEAGERLESLRHPRVAEAGGSFDLLLRPHAVAELVAHLVVSAATGDEAKRGRSLWSDALGQPVSDAGFTFADEPRHPQAIGGVPFDDEGVPTSRVPLIEAGVLRNFLYDSWDAHEHGARTTASAVRAGFKARPEAGAHHLVATHRATRPLAELAAGIDDGFVVEGVLGAHTANATTGDFSVTSPVAWKIRRGAVEHPVREIAVAGSLPGLLRRLDAASRETKRMEGALLPTLRFRDVAVSV